jgi:hypothetical protein
MVAMRRRLFVAPLAVALAAALAAPAFAGSNVGDDAPALTPGGWLNNKGPVSWEKFQGKLVLIEKWATW